jgi:hypothetical protein
MSDNSGLIGSLTDLGIDPSSLDNDSDLETDSSSMEAEGEVKEEEVKATTENEDESDIPVNPEDGEKVSEPVTEPVIEEPKLTIKQFQEIEAAKQSLEVERRAFQEEKQKMEMDFQKNYHEKIKAHDELDSYLADVAQNDPDLFDLIKAGFSEHRKQFFNPAVDQIRQETQSLRKELDSFKASASDEVTRTKLDSEINQVKGTLGKEAEAAGVKIDWMKVEDTWADNPKLSIESAVYALYGANIAKAQASKASVAAVTNKVAARPSVSTAGNVSHSNKSAQENIPKDAYGAVQYYARKLTGKSA